MMIVNGLDTLFHKAILQSIQDEMDDKRFQHIKQSLQEQGIKFSDLISKFGEARKPLFEFEQELNKIEDRIFREFLVIEEGPSETWLTVRNRRLTELILKTFADEDKKMILDFMVAKPETIPRTLVLCSIPNTSGYRKMRQLIDNGFVVSTGLVETFEGRRTLLYKSIIQKIQIIIDKGEISTRITVPSEVLNSSIIVKTIVEVSQGRRRLAN